MHMSCMHMYKIPMRLGQQARQINLVLYCIATYSQEPHATSSLHARYDTTDYFNIGLNSLLNDNFVGFSDFNCTLKGGIKPKLIVLHL